MARVKSVLAAAMGAALGTLMFASSANALSCAPTDIAAAMERAKASEKNYYILVGHFNFRTPPANPKFDPQNQQQRAPRYARASFNGFSLTPQRYTDVPLRHYPVDIEVSCLGPWCGGFPQSSQKQIAFVEERYGQAPILRISACPGQTFGYDPQRPQLPKLRQCFYQRCESEDHYARFR